MLRETSDLHLLQQVVNSPDKWNVSYVSSLRGFRGRQMLLFLRSSNAGHDAMRRASLFSGNKYNALPAALPSLGQVLMALLTQAPSCHLPFSQIAPGKGLLWKLGETQEHMGVTGSHHCLLPVYNLASLPWCLPSWYLFTLGETVCDSSGAVPAELYTRVSYMTKIKKYLFTLINFVIYLLICFPESSATNAIWC